MSSALVNARVLAFRRWAAERLSPGRPDEDVTRDSDRQALADSARITAERDGYKSAYFWVANEVARVKNDLERVRERLASLASPAGEPSSGGLGGASLRLVCVGTGRDGTTSLARMVEEAIDSRRRGETSSHEWGSVEINAAFCEWKESDDPQHLKRIEGILRECPHAAIVGNGYAAVLPSIRAIFGPDVTVVHLRRSGREACIQSLASNAALHPMNHHYYSPVPEAIGKRPAAFHFGEMTREEWDRLPLVDKFGWYYDKTHALIREHSALFNCTVEIETERLDDESTRLQLADLIGTETVPQVAHLNRHVASDSASIFQRLFSQRLIGRLDGERLARDALHGLRHVIGEYIRYLGERSLEVNVAPDARRDFAATLAEARALLQEGVTAMRSLESHLGVAGDTTEDLPES